MSKGSSKVPVAKPKAKWGWVSALAVSALALFLSLTLVAIVIIVLGWDIEDLNRLQTYAIGIMSALFPLVGIWLYLRKIKAGPKDIGLDERPKPFIKPLFKTFGFYVLSTMAAILALSMLAPAVDLDQAQDLGLGGDPTFWYQYVMLGLLLVVFTPISEEVLFRGFMLKGLAGRFGWVKAAVATSVLFGLVHGQLNVAIDTAIMGWFSAQLVITTKSLWPSIALHALKNSIAFILVYIGPLV